MAEIFYCSELFWIFISSCIRAPLLAIAFFNSFFNISGLYFTRKCFVIIFGKVSPFSLSSDKAAYNSAILSLAISVSYLLALWMVVYRLQYSASLPILRISWSTRFLPSSSVALLANPSCFWIKCCISFRIVLHCWLAFSFEFIFKVFVSALNSLRLFFKFESNTTFIFLLSGMPQITPGSQ